MNAGVPQKLCRYNLYYGNAIKAMGIQAETQLPEFEAMTTTLSGAGILGEIDSPNIGNFGSLKLPISFRTLTDEAATLAAPEVQSITLRADQDSYDVTAGKNLHRALKVVVRGMPTKFSGGKLKAGEPTDTSVELEIHYIKIEENGKTLLELDKFNSIFIMNGIDYLAEVNKNT